MKENTIQAIDPAETCESNPEWSSAPGNNDWDDCRCSIIAPAKTSHPQDKK
ncbi:hypothetical protein UWK_00203 [Desulfocapsa sulfexigens DSM 10523]|uniref:Uncharacterized protein n=1 Tax=Desulfocapsa sulfexigens (strain DSM 10523 / SB164P1) TaxID=1167006 RepID=M1NAA7_DESSD|nr:hypothetical protein [Desulfocapsa sulfexigens]AGF76789.1 hypothetical protein UWK_00203 [Desulfocapsa sulfexigens DSM 10523]